MKVLLLLLVLKICSCQYLHYTNDWVVRIQGTSELADQLAWEFGYRNLGQVKGFPGTYRLRKVDHPLKTKRDALHLTTRLSGDQRVIWAEQQIAKRRVKRGYTRMPHASLRFNDELWENQWYLSDTRAMPNLPEIDHHVTAVWDMNITGKGVVVTILDDGLEWNHTDIYGNYDPKASWDANDNDDDPMPEYDESNSNNHGTRCAGEVAMIANNRKCGVGVAYNAKIGGIRMLDGVVDDIVESSSLVHQINHIDIFSASWGPTDDGKTLDGPGTLTKEALKKGIKEGRGGKGVIYVWASGNGGIKEDNCNCDGYTSSIYTLAVGSASQQGQFPWYGERCSSTFAATFSSGAYSDQKISTTDLHNSCTTQHTGTSASAPLAAGIFALVLEANPELTWRDIQHIVTWTTDVGVLLHNKGWRQNGVGLLYNSRFGYGLLNAHRMVLAAKNWTRVPDSTMCSVETHSKLPQIIASEYEGEFYFKTNGCQGSEQEINYLEHVQVRVDIDYNMRGALDIFLTSPSGSVTMLLSRREEDDSALGFQNWEFLTIHLWGENPSGIWKLLIRDKIGRSFKGSVKRLELVLHGTTKKPEYRNQKRVYELNQQLEQVLEKGKELDENDENELNYFKPHASFENRLDSWLDMTSDSFKKSEIRLRSYPYSRLIYPLQKRSLYEKNNPFDYYEEK